jgi:DNA-binding transcriptional LysR family regulator
LRHGDSVADASSVARLRGWNNGATGIAPLRATQRRRSADTRWMEMLNEMAVFAQVVDSGGFSPAARALGVEPSSVSRSVARLEKSLGARLLHRTSRAIALTEVGEQVYRQCARIVSSARDAQALASSYRAEPAGVLRVSAPVVFGQVWLAPRLAGFVAAYPEVNLQVTLVDRPVDLLEDGVDLAIRIAEELPPGVAARTLCAMRYMLVASPAYLLAHGTPATPAALADHRFITLGHGTFGPSWTMHRGDEQVEVVVPSRFTANNSALIATMAEGGTGIALVPDFTARSALANGRLVQLLPDWELGSPYRRAIWLVYTPGPHLARKIRVFIDHLVASVSRD